MYFPYGSTEIEYLKRRDKVLGAVIDRVGRVERAVDPDLFSSVVHHIVGQQISTKAQATICPAAILGAPQIIVSGSAVPTSTDSLCR